MLACYQQVVPTIRISRQERETATNYQKCLMLTLTGCQPLDCLTARLLDRQVGAMASMVVIVYVWENPGVFKQTEMVVEETKSDQLCLCL